jgi:hypothetical protein
MNTSTLICEEKTVVVQDRKFSRTIRGSRGNNNYSDQDLLDGIKRRDNRTLEFIYQQCYPMIQDLVIRHSGNHEDAQDIFQDAMVIIYNKVKKTSLFVLCI